MKTDFVFVLKENNLFSLGSGLDAPADEITNDDLKKEFPTDEITNDDLEKEFPT